MEIGAASLSGAALQQQYNVQKAQSDDFAEQVRAREQTSSSREVATANAESSRIQAAQTQKSNARDEQAEAPKIFVNAQGQKTGTIISVTA